jgi:hypothetical protein
MSKPFVLSLSKHAFKLALQLMDALRQAQR